MNEASVFRCVDFHELRRAAERDELLIRAEVRGEHLIEFLAHRRDAFARLDFPNHDLARLPATPAAGEDELAVAAEADDRRKALGEGEHAERFERLGVEKDDLLLPAERHQWRPRARAERGERIRFCRVDDGIEREFARHRRRAFGTRQRDDGDLHVVRRDRDGLAAGGFEKLAVDPLAHDGDFAVGKFVALRRHLRILRLHYALEEQAAAAVAGPEHLAVFATLQRALVSREIEPGLFFVGVVAVQAGVAENGEDVVAVVGFVGRLGAGGKRERREKKSRHPERSAGGKAGEAQSKDF